MTSTLILLQCAQRTGHFGQGTFVNTLLPLFQKMENIDFNIVLTDAPDVGKAEWKVNTGINNLLIPSLGMARLTGESNPQQHHYANIIAGILYEQFRQKSNPIFWINTIDYLNVCRECKSLFPSLRIIYVHHSFTWKYMLRIPDEAFKLLWKKGRNEVHPKAFEMTGYQHTIAMLADQVVTVTDHAKVFFITVLDVPVQKIKMIYNGAQRPLGRQLSKNELRTKYGFSKSDKIVVICGRVTKDKGIPDAIKAFQILAEQHVNLKLVVIGTGYIADYLHLAAPYWSRVIYTGELNTVIVREFYTLSDIGIIPSYHEQCSFTSIEMRFHKLPLIVSDTDGLKEMFEHEVDALKIPLLLNKYGLQELDVIKLAASIELLMNDAKLAKKISYRSYQIAMKRFSLLNMHIAYEKLIFGLFTKP